MRIQMMLSAALLAGAAHAQDNPPAPQVTFESLKNSGGQTFADFTGRVVLLEQFAYW